VTPRWITRGARAALVVGVVATSCAATFADRPDTAGRAAAARAASDDFLDRYVEPDGRVVRRDQGGDTVSEGQAYALLITVATGDRARFARVWTWTAQHLQRPDGLLSWHWADGHVVDPEAAADADLDAARALVFAAERFDEPSYLDQAQRIGGAVLDQETATLGGRLVLVAGPWARQPPVRLNPSYIAPQTFTALAGVTGDRRWMQLIDSGVADLRELTAGDLPPDWAEVEDDGSAQPTSSPAGETPHYGYDAARVPLRLGEACAPGSRDIAANLWPRLRGRRNQHPVGFVGAAAAAGATGDYGARDRLLAAAQSRDAQQPTYYGAAWVALGRIMLTTDFLGSCRAR